MRGVVWCVGAGRTCANANQSAWNPKLAILLDLHLVIFNPTQSTSIDSSIDLNLIVGASNSCSTRPDPSNPRIWNLPRRCAPSQPAG